MHNIIIVIINILIIVNIVIIILINLAAHSRGVRMKSQVARRQRFDDFCRRTAQRKRAKVKLSPRAP